MPAASTSAPLRHPSTRPCASLISGAAILLALAGVASAQNHAPNPYETQATWAEAPPGRAWGSTSAVFPARDGSGNIWVAERCGANLCTDKPDLDPIVLYSPAGKVLKSFGKGQYLWPHGIFVDPQNNVWVTDARGGAGKGHQIHKWSPDGKLLMSLGVAGVGGMGETIFKDPSDILAAPDGSLFIADGHGATGNNRIVKLAADGKFVKQWGTTGAEAGEFRDPHDLAMDSQGRLFVGDRGNSRIQIFDADGNFIAQWHQFGRPSGIYISKDDTLYSVDSQSDDKVNPGVKRGIRIGSAKDGTVRAFIPDLSKDPAIAMAEGVSADPKGATIYAAGVSSMGLHLFVKQ